MLHKQAHACTLTPIRIDIHYGVTPGLHPSLAVAPRNFFRGASLSGTASIEGSAGKMSKKVHQIHQRNHERPEVTFSGPSLLAYQSSPLVDGRDWI